MTRIHNQGIHTLNITLIPNYQHHQLSQKITRIKLNFKTDEKLTLIFQVSSHLRVSTVKTTQYISIAF